MLRPVPNHFEELSLIDVRISPTLIEKLMGSLLNTSRVKKLALVSLLHTDRSFESVIEFVRGSFYLRELDISWSNVRPSIMLPLLKEISTNQSMVSLTLAYNELLEEQPCMEKEKEELGEDEEEK